MSGFERGSTAISGDATYMVWASDKYDAIEKACALVGDSHDIVGVEAERFPEGADYHVNWKVTVRWVDE